MFYKPLSVLTSFIIGLLLFLVLSIPHLIEPIKYQLVMMPSSWPGNLGFVLIHHLGLDKTYELDVELSRLATYDDMIRAFRNHVTNALNSTLDVAVNLAATEKDIRVIYAYNESIGADGMVANNDIKSIQDLRGRRIGAETGATSHYLLLAILKKAGLTPNDVTFVDVQTDEVQQALTTKKVDAVVTWEPNLSKAGTLPGMHILTTSKDYPHLILNVLIVREPALHGHLKTYAHLIKAWNTMRQLCQTNSARCWKLLSKDQNRPVSELIAESKGIRFLNLRDNRLLFSEKGGAGTITEQLQATYDFLQEYNLSLPEFDPTFLYEPAIVQAVQQLSGE
jgi:NitT/TauT family transport system substrate-binding protein